MKSLLIKKNLWIVVTLILLAIVLVTHRSLPTKSQAPLKFVVNTAPVQTKAMPLQVILTGSIEPLQSVTVRPQVTGTISKIAVSPGQEVAAGQLLFEINPESFQADYNLAKANLAKDQAKLQENVADANRFKPLVKEGYVSQQQFDQTNANAIMQKESVAADQENLNQAQIKLNYTQIKAPIAGRIGDIAIKTGDLVTAAAQAPIVTINQLNPVLVTFSLPQSDLPQLLQYRSKNPIWVEVWDETQNQSLGKGQLVFIDNAINDETGTILLKASIPNDKQLLWPGLMVSVKLILTTDANAIVIPTSAVRTDQQGNFVFRVEKGRAIAQPIKVNRQIDDWTVVTKGLTPGEQIVTIAPPDLTNLSEIEIFSNHAAP